MWKGVVLGVCCALAAASVALFAGLLVDDDESISLWAVMALSGCVNTAACLLFLVSKNCTSSRPMTFIEILHDALGPRSGYALAEVASICAFSLAAFDLAAYDTGLGIAIVSSLKYLSVVWSACFGSCVLQEKLSKLQVLGVLVCVVGTTGVAGVFDLIADSSLTIIWSGVVYALASSVFFSGLLFSNRFLHYVAPDHTPMQLFLWFYVNRAVIGTAFTLILGDEDQLPSTTYQWALLLLYSFALLLTTYLVFITTKLLPSHILNVLMTLTVFFSLIYQIWVWENIPETWAIVCIFVQIAGVIMAQHSTRQVVTTEETISANESGGSSRNNVEADSIQL
eukprot:TRINITY_DN14126_c0_g1_i1.p1 TRINITY_DN14126_c0_g1~~TRINITY_DN14126_c0_g1_i1.p1  ORF type:complete len:339 (-),score=79.56 TRINITY_DN14126_c0_g1_i1:37-1053(-)